MIKSLHAHVLIGVTGLKKCVQTKCVQSGDRTQIFAAIRYPHMASCNNAVYYGGPWRYQIDWSFTFYGGDEFGSSKSNWLGFMVMA